MPLLTKGGSQVLVGLGIDRGPGLDGLSISNQLLFSHLRQYVELLKIGASDDKEVIEFKNSSLASTSVVESGAIVTEALIQKLSKSFHTLETNVDARKPLHSYGVDSLLVLELRNWLTREFGADIPVFEILCGSTFSSVGLTVPARSEDKQIIWNSKPDVGSS